MKPLHRKKAIALYETRMRPGYVVKTVVCYLFAAVLWYALAVIVPYTPTITVSAADNAKITRAAFSASQEQIEANEADKERALLMPTSEQSFCRRLKLVEDAQMTVDHMIFDTYEGKFSEYYYTSLIRAADRGVRVRVLVDGKLGKLGGNLTDLGKIIQNHDNIELYYFNEFNFWQPSALMTLMHDKVLIVDGNKMIVGGVNMGTGAYLNNFDMEVMITNSDENGSVGQAERYYSDMLKSDYVKRIKSKKRDHSDKNRYLKQYEEYYSGSEFADSEVDYSKQGIAVDKVTYVTNKIAVNKKSPIVMQAIFNLMESSKRTVAVTPYTLLQDDKKAELRRLASKNDSFTLITNSLYNTRNVGYADYYYTREDYLTEKITLLEYQAENQIHAKLFSFDNRFSIIGSFNLDERSCHIDTESVVVIDSPDFNAVLEEYIERVFVSNSLQVDKNNSYIPKDGVIARSAPSNKRFKYSLYRMLGLVRYLI